MCGFTIALEGVELDKNKIAHRGIKTTEITDHGFVMTHQKLPFQTLTDDDFDQPVLLRHTGNYMLFNGEIFNHKDLDSSFKNDVQFLKYYFDDENFIEKLKNGKLYQKFDGFWSIAIVTENDIFVITDPLGQKQLYYNIETCAISSEIKAISNGELNEYYPLKITRELEITPFADVKRFKPNCLYQINKDKTITCLKEHVFDLRNTKPDFYEYYKPNDDEFYYATAQVELYEKLYNSVKQRLVSNEFNGKNTLFLSGGLDSTIILSILEDLNVLDQFEFLTIENLNDAKYVEICEEYFNIKAKRISIPDEINFDEILKAYEHPLDLGSLIPNWYLCKEAIGKMILTGDGADELFNGYGRAQKYDTQNYDTFVELPYYHNIRLDRMSMYFTKELRAPFLSHEIIRFAMTIPYEYRIGKRILKDTFRGSIPDEIIDRKKDPLRVASMAENREKHINDINDKFHNLFS